MISPRRLARLQRSLSAAGAGLQRVRYPRPGGETDGFRWTPAGRPRGRVLVAHGAGNDALFPLLALFGRLVAEGWELFAFDLDGHGRASTSVYTVGGIREALPAARRAAEQGRDALPTHVMGHSLGGSLVLDALAAGRLAGVRSATVLSAPVSLCVTARSAAAELRAFLRTATLSQRRHYGLWGLVPAVGALRRGAYPFRMASGLRGRGAFGYVPAVASLLQEIGLADAAHRVDCPVLLVYSRADALVPAAQGRRLVEAVPRASLLELERESHWSLPWAPATLDGVSGWLAEHA